MSKHGVSGQTPYMAGVSSLAALSYNSDPLFTLHIYKTTISKEFAATFHQNDSAVTAKSKFAVTNILINVLLLSILDYPYGQCKGREA